MELIAKIFFLFYIFILTHISFSKSGKISRPRHVNPKTFITSKISQIKKSLIPGLEKNLQKATEALSSFLDQDLEKKINNAKKDLESVIKSTFDTKFLQKASLVKNSQDCYDTLQNCQELKESNVCKTSQEAMNKSCKKTCGFCNESILDINFAPLQVKLDIQPFTSDKIRKTKRKKASTTHLKNSHKFKKHKQHKKEKSKFNIAKSHSIKQEYPKCPSICKTNCMKGCPLECCKPKFTQPNLKAVNNAADYNCPFRCKEICSEDCPEVCCLKRLFSEIAKNYEKPSINQNINDPKIFSDRQNFLNYDSSFLNPTNNMFTCNAGCPKSCLPDCTEECCSPSQYQGSDPSAILKFVLDSSKMISDKTTPSYQASPVNEQMLAASFQPLIQSYSYPSLQADMSHNNLNSYMDITHNNAFPLVQTTSFTPTTSQECNLSCKIICSPDCQKECCSEDIDTILKQAENTKVDEINSCPSECDHHCTPSCLYSHCCKD